MQISSSSQASLQCTARPRYLCSSQLSAGLHHTAVSPSYLLSCHTATWLRAVNKILETEKSSGLGRLEINFPPGSQGPRLLLRALSCAKYSEHGLRNVMQSKFEYWTFCARFLFDDENKYNTWNSWILLLRFFYKMKKKHTFNVIMETL